MKMLRPVLVPTAVVVALCVVAAAFIGGREAAAGAALGGVMVCLFCSSTPLLLNPVTKASPAASLPVSVLFFSAKVMVFMALAWILIDDDGIGRGFDLQAIGVTALITSLTWTILQIVAFRRQRVLVYDLSAEKSGSPDNL